MMKLKYIIIVVIIILSTYTLILSGCSIKDETQEDIPVDNEINEENKDEKSEDQISEDIIIDGFECPLCGKLIEREDIENKRVFAVMIDNHPNSVPQSGLGEANLVYELPVEGGITRYLAFYYHTDKETKIGPVRSARHYHYDLIMEYDAVFAYFGGSPLAWEQASKLNIQGFNGIHDGVTFYAYNERRPPHDKYTSMDRITDSIDRRGFNRESDTRTFNFHIEDMKINGDEAKSIKITYPPVNYNISYVFDENEKKYIRHIGKTPHEDKSGEQLKAKNIIIQQVRTRLIAGDDEGRLEIDLVSDGTGYYLTNGSIIDITWKKTDRRDETIFLKPDGTELKLNAGNTWVQILPNNGKIQIMN